LAAEQIDLTFNLDLDLYKVDGEIWRWTFVPNFMKIWLLFLEKLANVMNERTNV